ncbi:MAG: MraY family glycosyltransferase [Prevotellaceae bacterium]|nr:MraY family glycosyltransferase [Prevotellaceae bacterium]
MNIYTFCIIGVFLISTICGLVFIPIILNFCKKRRLYDIPNERKVHHNAVPRLGGISFMPSMFISFAIALAFLNSSEQLITVNLWSFYFLISILLIYCMGIIDDVLGLTPLTKFIVQIIAACILPLSGLYINNLYGFMGIYEIPYIVGFPLTVLAIVFIDNAMNLIDGIDGLAASLAIIALIGFLYIFVTQGVWSYSILIAGLIGVLVSFLYFNLFGEVEKNRKIFMGDSGSLTIGFILGFLCIKYSMDNVLVMSDHKFSFIMAFTLLIVPMFDVVRVFLVRIYHHKSPFTADKNHIHHKFMKAGCSQHKTLVMILMLAVFYIFLNHYLLCVLSNTIVFVVDVVIYIGLNLILNYFIKKKEHMAALAN